MNNSDLLFLVLVALFIIWAVYANKNNESPPPSSISTAMNDDRSSNYELINPREDAYELLGNVDVDEAFNLGFGMGPGIYGSGRHTFEMNVLR